MEYLQKLIALIEFIAAQSSTVHLWLTIFGLMAAYFSLVVMDAGRRILDAVVRRIEGRMEGAITREELNRRLADHRRLLLVDGRRLLLDTQGETGSEVEEAEEVPPPASSAERPPRRVSVVTKIRRQADTVVRLMAGDEWVEHRKNLDRLVRTVVPAITTRRQEVSRALARLRKLDDGKAAERPGAAKTREHVETLERLSAELEGQLDAVLDALVGMEATILGHRETGAGVPTTTGELAQLMDRVEGNARNMADALREVSALQT